MENWKKNKNKIGHPILKGSSQRTISSDYLTSINQLPTRTRETGQPTSARFPNEFIWKGNISTGLDAYGFSFDRAKECVFSYLTSTDNPEMVRLVSCKLHRGCYMYILCIALGPDDPSSISWHIKMLSFHHHLRSHTYYIQFMYDRTWIGIWSNHPTSYNQEKGCMTHDKDPIGFFLMPSLPTIAK